MPEDVNKTPSPPLPAPTGSAPAWPNIGDDPLKVGDMELSTAIQRMRTACDLQQAGVPDQTALVWRIDINRVLSELTLMTARWNLHKQNETGQAHREEHKTQLW